MTRTTFLKIFLICICVLAAFGVFGLFSASAQTGGTCQVMSASFRSIRTVDDDFFDEESIPYVYIDFVTQNCAGESIEVSITEDDNGVDDDITGNLGILETCDNTNNSCMDNRIIAVPSNNFTLSLITGEDECQAVLGIDDCNYHIETWDEVTSGQEWEAGLALDYECDGACDLNWQYNGILQDYEGYDVNDPDYETVAPVEDDDVVAPVDGDPAAVDPGIADFTFSSTINNPLGEDFDILEFFRKLFGNLVKIAIPIMVIFIIYSGFLFVEAQGNEEKLAGAKKNFLYVIIGVALILGAWTIATLLKGTVEELEAPIALLRSIINLV